MKKLNYKQIIAVVYTIVLFLDRLDLTIINVTFPTVAKYFNVSIIATDWISLAFLLALTISIPISGWLNNAVGLKKLYVIAMLIFGLGSTLCAFVTSLNQLIILRFIQGIGGGILIPVGITLIYRVYDKSEYASITSFTFLPALIAPAIAPFCGGLLMEAFGWQTVFIFSGPICLLLATCSFIYIKEEPHQVKYPLDIKGFILSSIILIDTFYGLSQLSKYGFTTEIMIEGAILIPLIWVFIVIETQNEFPLINLKFFRNEIFVRANLIQLCFQICHFGAIFLVGIFLQVGIGFSAVVAGLIMGMQAIGAMTTSRYSVRLFNAKGARFPIIIGLIGLAILSPMILLINSQERLVFGLALFFVRGIFSGLCGTPIQTLSIIKFDKDEISTVNSIFNVCRQVSISLGVAISSLLIALGMHSAGVAPTSFISSDKVIEVFIYGFWAIPLVTIVGLCIAIGIKETDSLTRHVSKL